MLKRIKLIQGIGTFTQSSAGGIELSNVTILFGENRYGKSTLCDVLRSLAEDLPDCILDRQCIPNDPNKPPKVELQFETVKGNISSNFENGQWQVKSPDCSKLYVFDHNFIHRNVMTGQSLERSNSENMTSFILGENNTALFKALANVNKSLREEKKRLSTIKEQFTLHAVNNIQEYSESTLSVKAKEQLEVDITTYETSKQQLITTIQNIDKIKQRGVLNGVGTQVDFTQVCASINSVLVSSLQNIHQESLNTLQNHMAHHVNNSSVFKGWASQGLAQIKDSCPFCGQALMEDAKSLIVAYQQAFNAEFNTFNRQTKQTLNGLRQPFEIPNTREDIIQQHQSNGQLFQLYTEPQIMSNQELKSLVPLLESKYKAILASFDTVMASSQRATEFLKPRLEQKISIPYDPAEEINFNELLQATRTYNKAIYEYWTIVEKINNQFNAYKDSLNKADLNAQLETMEKQKSEANSALKRIMLDPLCVQYKQNLAYINTLDTSYKTQKQQLEESKTLYLDNYFNLINQLFHQLGSNDFEIIKVPNNRGKQVVYDLRVKFKGEDIPEDRISTVFSESDRRSLALCIFLAKVMSLPPEEEAKAILVLDDPVTSFDNERIALILNKLDELQKTVKQLIITTHYKGMAVKAVKKFKGCKSIRLVNNANTCLIKSVDNDSLLANEHDLAFDRIKAFVSRETNEEIVTILRPFLEEEVRYRFKKQLLDLGKSKSDLSACIIALKNHGYITDNIELKLNTIRDTLNASMHALDDNALENIRSLAEQVLSIIYNDL
jgi:wobble nucleotide-excising tRNase